MDGHISEQPADERPQLIEVVGPRDVEVRSNRKLRALTHGRNAEHHHRHILPQRGAFTNPPGALDDLVRRPAEGNENHVRPLTAGLFDRLAFVPGGMHAVANGGQELFYAVPGFLDIVGDQDNSIELRSPLHQAALRARALVTCAEILWI
jgi:hypothetical protein